MRNLISRQEVILTLSSPFSASNIDPNGSLNTPQPR